MARNKFIPTADKRQAVLKAQAIAVQARFKVAAVMQGDIVVSPAGTMTVRSEPMVALPSAAHKAFAAAVRAAYNLDPTTSVLTTTIR